MTRSPARTSSVARLVDRSTEELSGEVDEGTRDERENVGSDSVVADELVTFEDWGGSEETLGAELETS